MHLPTQSEIAAKIRELRIPAESMSREQARAEAVQAILDDRTPAPEQPAGHVLSRSMVAIADGHLEVTITHHPSTTEETAP